jgi:hypothetical protein
MFKPPNPSFVGCYSFWFVRSVSFRTLLTEECRGDG